MIYIQGPPFNLNSVNVSETHDATVFILSMYLAGLIKYHLTLTVLVTAIDALRHIETG